MSYRAFTNSVTILTPRLQVDEHQSRRRTGSEPITPTLKVHMCIRWMSGASYHDVRTLPGVSKTAFFASVDEVIDALLEEPTLQLKFPTGCVGAIDGWLCPIQTPTRDEADRPTAFFSGHYPTYGLNVQACCDHLSRFTAISCESAGGTGDTLAYLCWGLSSATERFPPGLHRIGDNAYSNGNNLLTPFTRPQITTPFRDSYNFHVSQLRIRIETAFGLLVKVEYFLSSVIALETVPRVIEAGFILHNYCIDQRLLADPNYAVERDEDFSEELPAIHVRQGVIRQLDHSVAATDASPFREQYMIADIQAGIPSGFQWVRDAVVQRTERNNILRPNYNIQRQQQELEQHELPA